MKAYSTLVAVLAVAAFALPRIVIAQDVGPTVLIVVAHPDDEAMFASSVYKITHELDGRVDLALVTDGAGGYRFSTLAEPIYGLDLTDPDVAREYLPAIRKKELMAGGKIVGIRDYFFLDQPDEGRSDDPEEFFGGTWDTTFVKDRLEHIMREGDYDFVFGHLPADVMHAHHKVSTILAMEVAETLEDEIRPVVLGGWFLSHTDSTLFGGEGASGFTFDMLDGYPITQVSEDVGPFSFDRNQPLGLDGRLNYKIVANWLIAEHKSQGTMQNFLGPRVDEEVYYYFAANDGIGVERTQELFDLLATPRPAPEP